MKLEHKTKKIVNKAITFKIETKVHLYLKYSHGL